MAPPNWQDIRRELADDKPPAPRDATAFWAGFRAKAGLTVQENAAEADPTVFPSLAWVATSLAAAMVITAVAVFTFVGRTPQNALIGPVAQAPTGPSRIKSLNVIASHSAVIIMNDEGNDGTVLWIADMNLDNDHGD